MANIVSIIFSLILGIPLFIVGPIILQVFLSKRDNKFVGLIIPIIQFVLSIVIVLSFSLSTVAFVSYDSDENTNISYSEVYEDATMSEDLDDEYDDYDEYDDADVGEFSDYGDDEVGSSTGISVLPSVIISFLLTNIPTAISLIIYFVNRKGKPKKKQLDKINIQDLG